MKKFAAVLFAALLVCAAMPAFAAYKTEYKLDIVPSITTAWGLGAQYFTDLVRARTNGRINIKVYPNAQLTTGKQTNAFMMIRNGSIDFACQSSINWSPQVVELNLFAMPFLVAEQPDRYAAMDAITGGKSGAMIKTAVELKGVKILAYGENGFRELTNSKREIHTPQDFEGLKVRVVGSKLFLDTYKAMGANSIAMNWSDTMTALQQGVVDGQENPINTFYPVKVYEYNKYMLDWHCVIDPTLFAVNPGVWKSFSKDDQKIVEEAAKEAAKYQIALARIGLDDGWAHDYLAKMGKLPEVTDWYKELAKVGMIVTKLTPEQTAAFATLAKPVRDEWYPKFPKIMDQAAADMAAVVKK